MSEPTTAGVYADTREHLLDELVRVDLLLRRHLEACWADQDGGADDFSGLFVSDQEVDRLLLRGWEAEARVTRSNDARNESTQHHTDEETTRLEPVTRTIRRRASRSIEAGVDLRLISLAAEFDLSELEVDALLLALAPDVDPKYERVYGYLRDDITKTRPTTDLLLRILMNSDAERLSAMELYSQRSTLVRERLILVEDGTTLPSRTVRVEERVVEYLLGSDAVAGPIDDVATVVQSESADSTPFIDDERLEIVDEIGQRVRDPGDGRTPDWIPLEPATDASPQFAEDARRGVSNESTEAIPRPSERPSFAAFVGPDERTAEMTITEVCADAHVPILRVDGRALPSSGLDEVLEIVRREARLQSSAIHVTSVGTLEPERRSPFGERSDAGDLAQASDDRIDRLVVGLDEFPSDVFLTGDATIAADLQPRLDHHQFTYVAFPRPNYEQRTAIWRAIEDLPAGADPAMLAGAFRLTRGGIEDAVTTARSLAGGALTETAVLEACRLHSRQGLDELAREIEPTYDWDHIVLPEDTLGHLHEIAGAIRHRGTVFEEWGFADRFSLGNGINVLFTGKSGTGKTMAAEIIANDVGLPLYKLDLSSVMSKYIGETEKNLRRVFDAAENSNAILFFDEADALFGKRTEISDSHDRYANVEVDYLLQRMEEHDGCVILASNLKENIDEAFRRRITAAVEFPKPDEEARREIWELIFPEETPTEELDLEFLAGFKLSGGDIKSSALTAAFLAAEAGEPVRMTYVVRGLQRELKKMGTLYDLETFGGYREAIE
ncbi:AAA family ATPase [Natronorarus salvus]|uniref:AAA family ATPase n=1 Tax=Natronorarus salvus TaxID=3117733 RepID=UPI002F26141B